MDFKKIYFFLKFKFQLCNIRLKLQSIIYCIVNQM